MITKEKKKEYNRTYDKKHSKELNIKKAIYRKLKDNGFYIRYRVIKMRCDHSYHHSYKDYGGRGIIFEWKNYQEFKKDMYESYSNHVEKFGKKNTTIDRIDVNGNYCKENCRWATTQEQNKNKRPYKKRMLK